MDKRVLINDKTQKDDDVPFHMVLILSILAILPVVGFLVSISKIYRDNDMTISLRRGYCISLTIQVVIMVILAIISIKFSIW